jgi:hypothetical protein
VLTYRTPDAPWHKDGETQQKAACGHIVPCNTLQYLAIVVCDILTAKQVPMLTTAGPGIMLPFPTLGQGRKAHCMDNFRQLWRHKCPNRDDALTGAPRSSNSSKARASVACRRNKYNAVLVDNLLHRKTKVAFYVWKQANQSNKCVSTQDSIMSSKKVAG